MNEGVGVQLGKYLEQSRIQRTHSELNEAHLQERAITIIIEYAHTWPIALYVHCTTQVDCAEQE